MVRKAYWSNVSTLIELVRSSCLCTLCIAQRPLFALFPFIPCSVPDRTTAMLFDVSFGLILVSARNMMMIGQRSDSLVHYHKIFRRLSLFCDSYLCQAVEFLLQQTLDSMLPVHCSVVQVQYSQMCLSGSGTAQRPCRSVVDTRTARIF